MPETSPTVQASQNTSVNMVAERRVGNGLKLQTRHGLAAVADILPTL